MAYQGGKARIRKDITQLILKAQSHGNRTVFAEPFAGGCSITSAVAETRRFDRIVAGELREDIVLMWQELVDGWEPDTNITKEQWEHWRDQTEPSAMRGFVGIAQSFSSAWFNTYSRNESLAVKYSKSKNIPKSYAEVNLRQYRRYADSMGGVEFRTGSYADTVDDVISDNTVVYLDPPYINTMKYKGVDEFDHDTYYSTWEEWVSRGAIVLGSEYHMPNQFVEVWSKKQKSIMSGSIHDNYIVDRVYVHESQAHIFAPPKTLF